MGELVELPRVSVYPSSPPGLLPRPVEEISMADVKTDRRQALDLAIASIDRQFGKGAIMRLGQNGAVDAIVIDSVAALVPRAELDGDMGDSLPGLQARLMSQALRKLTAAIARSGGAVIFINQIREKIGVMFGSPETTTGGRALT